MHDDLKSILQSIPKQSQRQDSLSDQLVVLVEFANRLGLYDAADYIKLRRFKHLLAART